jgi:AcrR family transcriptional regulator
MKGKETRAKIAQAAMRLASRDGLLTLTIDKVAEEAGLSKGGVMHHFATKEALLTGTISYFTEHVEGVLTRLVAEDPKPTFRWIRAMLRIFRQSHEETAAASTSGDLPEAVQLDRFMLSVLAAAVHNPELMKPIQSIGQRLLGRLTAVPEEGLDQLMLWLTLDGLFLWQFVGMLQPDDPLVQQVIDAVERRMEALTTTPHANGSTTASGAEAIGS